MTTPGITSRPSIAEHLVAHSAAMEEVIAMIQRVAPTDATVLVVGESGTGKELIARAIHDHSARRGQAMLAVNCGAIAETLIDSELFGHEKGAFTGATNSRAGLFEQADGGTILLDEITEMPVDLQTRLLRVLETQRIRRVGGNLEQAVNCRVIAATNRDPLASVSKGQLRGDLYYRLATFIIRVPPLRDRPGDVAILSQFFLDNLNRRFNREVRLDDDALEALSALPWPGNVRQLRNVIEHAFIMTDAPVIRLAALPPHLLGRTSSDPCEQQGDGRVTIPVGTTVAEAEQQLIQATLAHFAGDKDRAAETLGMSLRTLYNRLKLYRREVGARG